MIQDLKDLKALFKLCRAQGVTSLKLQGIEITLGNLPNGGSSQTVDDIETDIITDDQLLYYSTPQGQAELDKKVGMR